MPLEADSGVGWIETAGTGLLAVVERPALRPQPFGVPDDLRVGGDDDGQCWSEAASALAAAGRAAQASQARPRPTAPCRAALVAADVPGCAALGAVRDYRASATAAHRRAPRADAREMGARVA